MKNSSGDYKIKLSRTYLAEELGLARSTCALYLNRLVEKRILGKERGNATLEESNRKIYFYTKGNSSSELVARLATVET
jgi:predicted transcriptional regulator